MRVSYRVITPASVSPLRSNLLSPLDTIHYSTFDGDCQEGILVFFFSTARSHLHLGHYLPLAQPTGSHSLLTLCIVPQVGADYNRQTTQVSGKINKKICVKKLLTKLLAGVYNGEFRPRRAKSAGHYTTPRRVCQQVKLYKKMRGKSPHFQSI